MLAMSLQSVYGRLAGYEDVNDAEHLRIGATMRRVACSRAKEREATSTKGNAGSGCVLEAVSTMSAWR